MVISIMILVGVFDSFMNFFYFRSDGGNMFDIGVGVVGDYFSECGFFCFWWFL